MPINCRFWLGGVCAQRVVFRNLGVFKKNCHFLTFLGILEKGKIGSGGKSREVIFDTSEIGVNHLSQKFPIKNCQRLKLKFSKSVFFCFDP